MDEGILAAGGGRRTQILANFGVGVNNIDLDAAEAAGLIVTNTPGVLTDATADLAIALMLATTRRMSETEAILRRGEWTGFRPTGWLGMGLQGKTLGILGMGRIGQATARRAALGFGMGVIYFNRSPVGPFDFPAEPRPTIAAVMAEADVVSLHLPGGGSNRGLISAELIAAMKPTGYLVNTARGDVLDEPALIAALRERRIAGAGLDVYAEEPSVPPGPARAAERHAPAPYRLGDDRDPHRDGNAGGRQPHRPLRRRAPAVARGLTAAQPGLGKRNGGDHMQGAMPRRLGMQTRNKLLDDLAQLMSNALGVAQGAKVEAETAMKSLIDRWLADRNFVTREEFDAVRAMAQKAREENEALKARIDGLEAAANRPAG